MDETETKVPYSLAEGPPAPPAGGGQAVDIPPEDAAREGGDDAAADATKLDNPQDIKDKPAPPLLISIALYGVADNQGRHRSAFLGVREGEVDPLFETVLNCTLPDALASVAPLLEVARRRWATDPRYPAYQRPTPPPGSVTPPVPRPVAAAAPKKAPLPKSAHKGQTSIF